jgi:hypothetical protein
MIVTGLQASCINKAISQAKHKPWYQGIDIRNLPNDEEISKTGIDNVVNNLIFDSKPATGWESK